jgi:poly [ADP-ribose] polymerase
LDNQTYIKKEVELLEALTDMEITNSILKDATKMEDVNPIDSQYAGLGMQEMAPREITPCPTRATLKLIFDSGSRLY